MRNVVAIPNQTPRIAARLGKHLQLIATAAIVTSVASSWKRLGIHNSAGYLGFRRTQLGLHVQRAAGPA